MSRYSGPQGRGASRLERAARRAEADDRNARTPDSRRRVRREGPEELRAIARGLGR